MRKPSIASIIHQPEAALLALRDRMAADLPIYMDNHATTRVDPRVLEVMLPFFSEHYGNAGSTSHQYGWEAREAVDAARESIAAAIGAQPREIVFTSGATESNNLALRGVADRALSKQGLSNSHAWPPHIISVITEHKAILDPLEYLAHHGCEITLLPVEQAGSERAGSISADQVAAAIRDNTVLVSVMLANNEIGVIQPLAEIGAVCRQRKILLHTDATQAVGKMPVNVDDLQVDLLSFSAHKIYGPKGVGALFVRRRAPLVKLEPQIFGGGQENGFRSGTANVPGMVGMARALELCREEMLMEQPRLAMLRDRLYAGLTEQFPDILVNGPVLEQSIHRDGAIRLPGNLNLSFGDVDGEALLLDMQDRLAVSSGSACTSANPQPSHVLRALGLSDDAVRSSLRFGLGRFNTAEEVETAIQIVVDSVTRLRKLGSLA
ncbi:MAG TPA: cysteine desulfurase family protein [Pirellulales bacterium]|nr:cysteine desulfurase family protein [Pirellulales bacterium]